MPEKGSSVKKIIVITLISVTTIVTAVFATINYYREYNYHVNTLNLELKFISGQLSQSLVQPLWTLNFSGVASIIESIMKNQKNVSGVMVKEQRNFIARVRDKNWNIVATDQNIPVDGALYEKRDIVFNNEKIAELSVLSEEPPDLILLDVMMPGMDGYEVCRRLKADPCTKNIPVIFVTAKCDEQDETKGLRLGAVDYVTKPFSPEIVKARVQTHAELKKHRDFLESLSFRDGLTGIANRRRFDEYLATTWDFAARESSPLSLILIDVDHFKLFNDNYSHQAGDDCLKGIAQALAATLRRKIDLIARYGGEEFACILPKTPLHVAVAIAEQFQENILALQMPHAYSSTGGYVSISQGVAAAVPKNNLSSGILIKAADDSLYKSKANGRNKINSTDLNV